MNCYVHAERAAVAFCRTCGKALCDECQRTAQGTVYCTEHLPAQESAKPAVPMPAYQPGSRSPGLAFLFGLIPGVGAIYNGQYGKGLVHVIIFGLLISILSSHAAGGFVPLFGMLVFAFYVYMAFEAYHSAKRRQQGEPVDEFSSLFPIKTTSTGFPIGPVVLIALGAIFLLNTLGKLDLEKILRWWPVLLIVLGGYLLYARLASRPPRTGPNEEVEHER